ncbi:ubiquitin specific protease 16/45 isoform X2 [Arctopsyche grandis]|uniref:ubiquitin specific protease 16/45 isoform X2 n=1 Tax=Arctopsyche grandis TaxID=121162 RepID=UPI00406D6E63
MVLNRSRASAAERRASAMHNSSDSSAERSNSERSSATCPHLQKAVDLNKLRKAINKTGGLATACAKCPPPLPDADFIEDDTLWVCLTCGSQLCGRMRNKHALDHFKTPRSDLHCLAANQATLAVFCYSCNNEVDADSNRKLNEALDLIRRNDSHNRTTPAPAPAPASASAPDSDPERFSMKLPSHSSSTALPLPLSLPLSSSSESGVRRVRGLSNLGNTCFFNSVVQCLVQTPYLVDVLRQMASPGQKFQLAGGLMKYKPEKKAADEDKKEDGEAEEEAERDVELPPISGELSKWGELTETLADTLQELQTSGKHDVFSPSRLFKKFETKVPQFAGGDQHDSHELLRHLLEAVRSEDLLRYKVVILQKLGLDSKEKRSDIDEETKQKVKFYGQQASDSMLRPGQVFRGLLVSTLQCQDCQYASHTSEHFLDLSLPVTADKPQPPAITKRKTQDEQINCLGAPDNEKTKHQLKKEKAAARKLKKNKKGGNHGHTIKADDSNQNGDADNENKLENKSSSEQSDADVEDNVEENSKHQDNARDTALNFASFYMESGYNSEKVIGSDSIRSSPVDTSNAEKRDVSPERTDKDVEDSKLNLPSIAIALPYKTLAVDDSPLPSNPDSGVASPETAKHALSDTVNVESPITSKELGSPTSLSSEINMDISSPRQSNNSPVGAEMDRPVSRISFNDANHQKSVNFGTKFNADNEPDSSEDKINKINSSFDKINLTSTGGYEPTNRHNTIGSSHGLTLNVNEEENLPLRFANGPTRLPSPDIDSSRWKRDNRNNTVSPRYQCDDGEISIQSCLNQFTSSELLTGSNKVGCEACTKRANSGKTVYTNATKRFLISNPPAVLILHLKRFQLGPRCVLRKLTKSVNFPAILDIAPFCSDKVKSLPNVSQNQSKILYSLYGVVEHSGGMHLGHYVAYVKVRPEVKPGDARWRFLPNNGTDDQGNKLADLVNGANNANDNDTDSSLSGYESGEGAVGGLEVEPPSGKWYYISDSRVQETTEEKVLKVQAYLLFYERIL